jgi:hypothetical protein
MLKIAKSMTDAIKKALGIHSPSRVFKALGSYVGKGFALGLEGSRKDVLSSMKSGLGLDVDPSGMALSPSARSVAHTVSGAIDASSSEGGATKVLNYYAAPGSSLSSEEDLFTAANRARMVGW